MNPTAPLRSLPERTALPYALYRAEQVRELDRLAIEHYHIPALELMERAGQALLERARARFPNAQRWLVLCGTGNNGGDGFVLARLAQQQGLQVQVLQLGEAGRIGAAALQHRQQAQQAGVPFAEFDGQLPAAVDVMVDALLGTGLDRPLTGQWRQAVEAMNRHGAPVVSADIPSGLHADSGAELGVAVRAALTVSFIALKRGLFTGAGPDCCGQIEFAGLSVPARLYAAQLADCRRIDWPRLQGLVPARDRTAHKGSHGHVLVLGGAPGMSGAVRLAGEGALRSGAGLVSIATHPGHAVGIAMQRPELMCHGVRHGADLGQCLNAATVLVAGPGMGQEAWGRSLWEMALNSGRPMVLDADGLNLLAQTPRYLEQCIITPHPGEAARLLGCSTADVQADRFAAVERLRQRYAPVVVLKGAGTLIAAVGERPLALCSAGNPGMASGGMGDLLSGIIAALVAQGFDLQQAAELGVALHAAAGDRAAKEGERGLIASDLLPWLRPLLNGVQPC